MEILLKPDEACAMAGISRRTLSYLWRQGRGPARIEIGARTVRISSKALSVWIASRGGRQHA